VLNNRAVLAKKIFTCGKLTLNERKVVPSRHRSGNFLQIRPTFEIKNDAQAKIKINNMLIINNLNRSSFNPQDP